MAPCYLRMLEDLRGHLARPPRRSDDPDMMQFTKCMAGRYHTLRHSRRRRGGSFPALCHLGGGAGSGAVARRIRWDRLFIKFGDQNESSTDLVGAFWSPAVRTKSVPDQLYRPGERGRGGPGWRGADDPLAGRHQYRRYLDVPGWLCGGQTRGGELLRRWSRQADSRFVQAAGRRTAVQMESGSRRK